MSSKPAIFVASSREAERIALAVQQNLERDARVTVWTQDAFLLGQNVIDELSRNLSASDFGVFVFAPDDVAKIRGQRLKTVRDNVVLELGMFIGRLGKERSFVIKPAGTGLRLPTDLLGVVTGEYADRKDNPKAALASVCLQIGDAIKAQRSALSRLLDPVVETALETVCCAMSVPVTPEKASLRAFIFRHEDDELVCRHFWDPNPSKEQVGRTKFAVNKATASKIVVVRCLLDAKQPRQERGEVESDRVKALPKGFKGMKGRVNPSLRYVLAAPIFKEDRVLGVVDFDASNAVGKKLLQTEVSKSVILRLARHLSRVLS